MFVVLEHFNGIIWQIKKFGSLFFKGNFCVLLAISHLAQGRKQQQHGGGIVTVHLLYTVYIQCTRGDLVRVCDLQYQDVI